MNIRTTPTYLQGLIVALFLCAVWLAGLHWFTTRIEHPDAGAPRKKAAAIVVLTGGSNRLQTGFDLLEAGLGKKLFISGVYRGVEVNELLALWTKEKAIYPEGTIVLGFDADDTVGNARETAEWLRKQNYKSFYLVTSNYHLKRAELEFRMIAPDIHFYPYPVTPEGLDMPDWWRNKTHRSLIIREYLKYLVALLRYAVTVSPPQDDLAVEKQAAPSAPLQLAPQHGVPVHPALETGAENVSRETIPNEEAK